MLILQLILYASVLIILIVLLFWVLSKAHRPPQEPSSKDTPPEEEDSEFLCPNCGAPADVQGDFWECPWCGDFGRFL